MPERSELANMIFGRLTWEAIPYHEPILLATFAVVALVGLACRPCFGCCRTCSSW